MAVTLEVLLWSWVMNRTALCLPFQFVLCAFSCKGPKLLRHFLDGNRLGMCRLVS